MRINVNTAFLTRCCVRYRNMIEVFSLQTNSSIRASPRLSPRLSPRISPRPSPCLSPCLRRSLSSGSRSNSWKRRRSQDGDRKCLVPECKIDSMDTDDDDVFQPNCPTPNRSVQKCREDQIVTVKTWGRVKVVWDTC